MLEGNYFDKQYISPAICKRIINEYTPKVKLVTSDIRASKNYHERNKNTWLYSFIDEFIKTNIGVEYGLIQRVTVLRYDTGDYFLTHTDGSGNAFHNPNLQYHFYGGVELGERTDFDGGEFYIKNENVDFKKGRLFTHGFTDSHGVNTITSGTRWSIHFLIESNKPQPLI